MATRPRRILPGRRIHLTIRAVTRQHRFVPEKKIVRSIQYIFWYCVAKHGIAVHETTWMSNHAHIVLTDCKGVLPSFVQQLNSLISRQLNAIRGLKGGNFEKGYVDQDILSDCALLGLCAYTLANPCDADLVATARAWKSLTTVGKEYAQPFKVRRPKCGMWKNAEPGGCIDPTADAQVDGDESEVGPLPEEVVGVLVRPQIMGHLSDSELRAEIRARTAAREAKSAQRRRRVDKRVLGWRNVIKVKWNDFAGSLEELFREIPRNAASSESIKRFHETQLRAFWAEYEIQLGLFRRTKKHEAMFPPGTWKMRVTYNASCEPIPQLSS